MRKIIYAVQVLRNYRKNNIVLGQMKLLGTCNFQTDIFLFSFLSVDCNLNLVLTQKCEKRKKEKLYILQRSLYLHKLK